MRDGTCLTLVNCDARETAFESRAGAIGRVARRALRCTPALVLGAVPTMRELTVIVVQKLDPIMFNIAHYTPLLRNYTNLLTRAANESYARTIRVLLLGWGATFCAVSHRNMI